MEIYSTKFDYKNVNVKSREARQLVFSLEVYNDTLDNPSEILEILPSDITSKDGLILGRVEPEQRYITLFKVKSDMKFIWQLTNHTIFELERLRDNKNLDLELRIQFLKFGEPRQIYNYSCQINIPKSLWVEDILPRLGLDNAILISLPNISNNKINEHLQRAIKQFYTGDYPDVLADCQKALEELKTFCKTADIIEKDNNINFSKLSSSENVQKALDEITRKLFLFFQSGGRHIGRDINKEDAELALLSTYGLVNWVLLNTHPKHKDSI